LLLCWPASIVRLLCLHAPREHGTKEALLALETHNQRLAALVNTPRALCAILFSTLNGNRHYCYIKSQFVLLAESLNFTSLKPHQRDTSIATKTKSLKDLQPHLKVLQFPLSALNFKKLCVDRIFDQMSFILQTRQSIRYDRSHLIKCRN
jgi:hypothetical protein